MGPHPAVAAIRLAVRRALADVLDSLPPRSSAEPPPLVLAAVSGGADSMALASALAFEAPKLGIRAGAVTVDHGLQDGSADRAEGVAARLRTLGLDPVDVAGVTVGRRGGPEAAARDARYEALSASARSHGACSVLLGHTRDDQAETVLLGLARGSGTRSLSGMPAVNGLYRRPFLLLDRDSTRKACHVQGLDVWEDPHNRDPAYTRARVRHEALPVLEKSLGKGVVEALARTAQLFRDDADALDTWAASAEQDVRDADGALDTRRLDSLPSAVR
ncbi:tRNA lysidine(34) synthetase TilS, partial [Streptomyces sp. DJ]